LAHRIVELLIGRLITDEGFRAAFLANPEQTLQDLCERGLELSRTEIAALLNTHPWMWGHAAQLLDPRLQKASLEAQHDLEKEKDRHV
jgi:hypothetical protein